MGLLLVYGLNNWLPTIMREADYDLGAQLAFLLVLNVGAIVGLLVAGTVADRIGARAAGIVWFAGAALFLALLSIRLPDRRHLRHGLPDRLLRLQRAGAGLRVRQRQPPAAGARDGAGLVGRRRPRRRDRRAGHHRRAVRRRATRSRAASTSSPSSARSARSRSASPYAAVLRTAPRPGAVPELTAASHVGGSVSPAGACGPGRRGSARTPRRSPRRWAPRRSRRAGRCPRARR